MRVSIADCIEGNNITDVVGTVGFRIGPSILVNKVGTDILYNACRDNTAILIIIILLIHTNSK